MESVLLVEDDEPFRTLVKKIISPHFTVHTRSSGHAALAYMRSGQLPSLVVTDLNLPELSGLELLQHMKRSGLLCEIPVVILSGQLEADIIKQCLKAGAAKYISKPFEPTRFLAELQELVKDKVAVATSKVR